MGRRRTDTSSYSRDLPADFIHTGARHVASAAAIVTRSVHVLDRGGIRSPEHRKSTNLENFKSVTQDIVNTQACFNLILFPGILLYDMGSISGF